MFKSRTCFDTLQVVERLKAIGESGDIAKMDAQEEVDLRQMNQRSFCCF